MLIPMNVKVKNAIRQESEDFILAKINGGEEKNEFFVGVIGMFLLYCLGKVLYPDTPHKTIQQELIKMGDEENGQ